MKKAMWILSVLSLIGTVAVFPFLPDSVPMHYNLAGEVDRFGSKYENLILPIIILAFCVFWHFFIGYYEKKAAKTGSGKEAAEAVSNAKVLKVAGVMTTALFAVMQACILFGAYAGATADSGHAPVDLLQVTSMGVGVMFVVLGNIMPKAKRNAAVGFRTVHSMFNDTTWRKTNRFAGIALMAAGLLTIITACLTKSPLTIILQLVYMFAAVLLSLFYSYKIYREERNKKETN